MVNALPPVVQELSVLADVVVNQICGWGQESFVLSLLCLAFETDWACPKIFS
jgi:3-dehydroquinate dehydratase